MPMTYNRPLPSPRELKEQYPLPPALAAQKDAGTGRSGLCSRGRAGNFW